MTPFELQRLRNLSVAVCVWLVRTTVAGNSISCIVNTGGSCASAACYSWRGETDCNAGRCFCVGDECASGDGSCTNEPYVINDTQYRIRNARWPEYYIDVDALGSVDVENIGTDEDDNKFTLTLPPLDSMQQGPLFLLVSVEWPDSLLRVYKGGSSDRRFKTRLQGVDGGLGDLVPDPSILDLGMVITIAPVGVPGDVDAPVMLSSIKWPNEYLYVTYFRWSVAVHRDDPGAGGYWFFEPPLPQDVRDQLPRYKGMLCKVSCGEVAGAWAAPLNWRVALLAAMLAALT